MFHLRAPDLKRDVIFRLSEVLTLGPVLKAQPLSSAASGLLIIWGEVWVSEGERERGFLELGFKTEFNQNHRDPQFLPH